jgi:hypothetical protein
MSLEVRLASDWFFVILALWKQANAVVVVLISSGAEMGRPLLSLTGKLSLQLLSRA